MPAKSAKKKKTVISKSKPAAKPDTSLEKYLLWALADNTPDLIYAKDASGRFLFANHAISDMMHVAAPEQLLGKTDFDFYPREIAQKFFDDELAVIKSGKALVDREERMADPKTGEMLWHLTTKVPMTNSAGTVIGIVGITRDITARKRAEEKIRQLNAELEQRVAERTAELAAERKLMRTLVDVMPDNIFAKDAQSRFILANQSVAHNMGVASPEELLGKSDFDFYSKDIAQSFYDDEQSIIQSCKSLIDREEPATDNTSGETRWLSTTKVPLRDEQGKVTGLVGISRNITARKRAEEQVRQLNAELEQRVVESSTELAAERKLMRTLVDVMPDNIYAKDAQSRFTLANQAVARYMGAATSDELLDKTDFDYFPKDQAQGFYDAEQAIMRSGKPLIDHEESAIDDVTGEVRWVLTTKIPLRDEQGKLTGLVGISRNITARKHYEEKIQQLNAELEQRVAERTAELATERKLMRTLVDVMPDNIFAKDTQSRFLLANKSVAQGMGVTPEELLGKSDFDFYSKDIAQNFYNDEQTIIQSGEPLIDREEIATDPNGDVRWMLTTKIPLRDERGKITGLVGISHNITKRKQAENALRDSEARFRGLTDLSSDWYWEQDDKLRFTYFPEVLQGADPAFDAKRLIGKTFHDLPSMLPVSGSWAEYEALTAERKPFRDIELRFGGGESRFISVSGMPVFGDDGRFAGYRGVGRDISDRKRTEERIQYLATHDGLTGLPNRVMFGEILNLAIQTARRYERHLAVLFIDLDRFKTINDTLGHETGDRLLREIAMRLTQALRASDVVARLGGDEFVVLVQEISEPQQAAMVARKILAATIRPMTLLGQECRVTASVGICLFPTDAEDEQSLMKNADIAMYRAKEEGKNNFQFYSESLKSQSLERLALENSMRRALEHNEFSLQYQAKLDFKSKRITGVEALIRWHHPDLGLVSPAQFIPLAEETGLIVPIGKWVLKTACAQSVAWQREGLPPMCMAVNLSARQFAEEDLINDIADVLKETGLAPELLELEITESMVMHNAERAIKVLTKIKEMGVRLAIDDFGTGYSSLAQIRRFPVDTLKVDRSFIREIPDVAEDSAIAEAIIAMGKTLSLTVVAEGVETLEQADFLKDRSCDEMQGFYFARPINPNELADFVRKHILDTSKPSPAE